MPLGKLARLERAVLIPVVLPCEAEWQTFGLADRDTVADGIGALTVRAPGTTATGAAMIRRYSGDKKSIEARTGDNGQTWSVKLFDNGRLTEYSGGTLAEVDALAVKHQLKLDR